MVTCRRGRRRLGLRAVAKLKIQICWNSKFTSQTWSCFSDGRVKAVAQRMVGIRGVRSTPRRWPGGRYQTRGRNRMFELHPDGDHLARAAAPASSGACRRAVRVQLLLRAATYRARRPLDGLPLTACVAVAAAVPVDAQNAPTGTWKLQNSFHSPNSAHPLFEKGLSQTEESSNCQPSPGISH